MVHYKDCLLLHFFSSGHPVLVAAVLKSILGRIPKQKIYMRIKENSIPLCRASPLARNHMESFHLTYNHGHKIMKQLKILV